MLGVLFAMLCNAIFLMGSHYLLKQPGGWVGIKDKNYYLEKQKNNKSWIGKFSKWINEFNLMASLRKISPNNEITYTALGVYFALCTITTMYTTQVELLGPNAQLMKIIYPFMLVTGTAMSLYPIWPLSVATSIKKTIIQIWYPIAIFYMLIFFSFFFIIVSKFAMLQTALFMMNLMIASLLLGWRLILPLIAIGFYSSVQFYQYYFGGESFIIHFGSPEFILLYLMLVVSLVLIIFLKPKQDYLEATEEKVETLETETVFLGHTNITLSEKVSDLKETVDYYDERDHQQQAEIDRLGATAQKILNNVNHELRLPIGNVMNFSEMLQDNLEKYDKEHLKIISKEVYQNSNRLSSMILNMLDLATLNANKLELDKKLVNLSEIVEDRVKLCRKVYLQDKSIDFKLTIQPEIMLSVDPNYFKQTIDNLVINAINFSEKGVIEITLKKDSKNVNFIISDQGKGIPPNEIYDVFTAFQEGSNTASKAQGRGVGLALCKAAIRAHGGDIEAESRKVGALIRFVIPV